MCLHAPLFSRSGHVILYTYLPKQVPPNIITCLDAYVSIIIVTWNPGYNLIVLRTDPNFMLLGDALEVWTPPPSYLVLGFLGFWPLVALGLVASYRKPSPALVGSIVWLFFALLMAYNPWVVQRRWLLGITIPLAILSVVGLDQVARPWLAANFSKRTLRWQAPLALLFTVVIMLSNIYQVLGYSLVVASQPVGLFDPGDRVAAVDWLAIHAQPEQVVLAPHETAFLVASRSALISYIGSPFETLHYDQKLIEVRKFYQDSIQSGWLLDSGADWVIVEDQPLEFSSRPDLNLAFQQGAVSVFRVIHE